MRGALLRKGVSSLRGEGWVDKTVEGDGVEHEENANSQDAENKTD